MEGVKKAPANPSALQSPCVLRQR